MAYKQKQTFSQPSRGLGDSIEKFTKATGIKKIVNKVSQALGVEDCGCDERRDSLNRVFPFKK
jgi:predicted naringenin-chalcone synthase|tara:strand:- start:47 stop:235 length:189 start_codon:yes stop_codon:yes gene_type:complete